MTLSPGLFSTGMLSPVRAASIHRAEALQRRRRPPGCVSPGRITTMSPSRHLLRGDRLSPAPSRSTTAVLGARSTSLPMASAVLALERASRNLPTVIRVRIMAADSKYRCVGVLVHQLHVPVAEPIGHAGTWRTARTPATPQSQWPPGNPCWAPGATAP